MQAPQKGVSLGGNKFGEADSLWLSRKKGERESSSGSGEERGRAKVCSAPVRRAVKEGRSERRGKQYFVLQRQKSMWQVGEKLRKRRRNSAKKREYLYTWRKLTNSGGVAGTE